MDIAEALTLMIAFGALVAFIVSDNNAKNNPSYASRRLGVILFTLKSAIPLNGCVYCGRFHVLAWGRSLLLYDYIVIIYNYHFLLSMVITLCIVYLTGKPFNIKRFMYFLPLYK
ncbi:putative holin-like toxin [Oceanobacillus oncorhynchi]|uniref:putative holin-like toxin n=1 Tax=Oceanobacillus oncorhynchi TaxID=545501 RepID=UPI0034D71CCA